MNTLLATLTQRDPAPFDSIVHIGCGPYAGLEDYAPLESKHLLLVEADPEAFAELAERHAGSESVTLVQALVRAEVGEAAFHRYSLPMLNSPLGIGRLREIYPRVELLETLPMQATSLPALLSERAPALGDRSLLVLDIPGQEADLLCSLPQAVLGKFPAIIVCGASESWHDGGKTIVQTTDCLAKLFFEPVDKNIDNQSWPVNLYRRDTVKAMMQAELENRASQLIARADEIRLQSERIQQCEDQLATAVEQNNQLASVYKNLVTQSAERDQQLVSERDEVRAERDALAAERDTLAAEKTALDVRVTTLVSESEALSVRLATLSSEHSTLATHHHLLVAERDTLLNRLDEFQKQLQVERRIVESLANSIQSNAQSFRQFALALNPPSIDGLRPENSKLNASATTVSQEPTHHNFEFLGASESKVVSAFLKGLSTPK